MQAVDRSFDPAGFLDGAEKAFRLIVAAFASGDRTTLRTLLSDDTYHAFEQAIAAREAAGQQQVSEIRAVPGVSIEAAELNGTVAHVTVKFVSDQISLTRDQAGNPVAGTDAVTEITDLWTFERDLSAQRSHLAPGRRAQRLMRSAGWLLAVLGLAACAVPPPSAAGAGPGTNPRL